MINPDIRSADDPRPPGLQGWNPKGLDELVALDQERRGLDRLAGDLPFAFQARPALKPSKELMTRWKHFQKDHGRGTGSCDWTLLDEFAFQHKLAWRPQIIGSCVVSNTFRAWVIRHMYQSVFISGEYLGRKEFGHENFAFYGPWSYGRMRKRANLRGGDGGYCEPMAETLIKDGVLPCDNPDLLAFLASRRLDRPDDFPEPQGQEGKKLYREFGNWNHLDQFRQYAECPLLECPSIHSVDQLEAMLQQGKPSFVCSAIAIKKTGEHPDGFAIHKRDPTNRWMHNMAFHGLIIASDGEVFFRLSNESWGEDEIYNVPFDEVDSWFQQTRVTVQTIGEIAPKSPVPLFSPFRPA